MTDKLWLIRTGKKQILGPVSRDKVIELIEKGALTEKDEITHGNGFWFQVHEKELLDKYLLGDIPQGFNPISEAPDVLTFQSPKEGTGTMDRVPGLEAKGETQTTLGAEGEEVHIPSGEDLEYPDMDSESAESGADDEIKVPEEDDLDYPDMGDISRPDITVVAPAPSVSVKAPENEDETRVLAVETGEDEEVHIPSGEDLEYPDMEAPAVALAPAEEELGDTGPEAPEAPPAPEAESVSLERKNTPHSAVARALSEKNRPALKVAPAAAELDEDEEEEEYEEKYEEKYEEEYEDEPPRPRRTQQSRQGVKQKREVRIKRTYEAPARNDRYLFVLLAMVLFLLASGIFYYYSKILGKPLPFLSEVFFSKAYAQTTVSQPQQIETSNLSKKKTL